MASRQLRNAAWSRRNTTTRAPIAKRRSRCEAACRSAYSPRIVRAVTGGELNRLEVGFEFLHDFGQIAFLDVGADIESAGPFRTLNDVGSGLYRDLGDIGHPDLLSAGSVQREVLDACDAGPDRRRTPDLDVVGFAVPVDVADLLTGDQGGCGTADVTGLQAIAVGGVQVHLDVHLRNIHLQGDFGSNGPLDAGEEPS